MGHHAAFLTLLTAREVWDQILGEIFQYFSDLTLFA